MPKKSPFGIPGLYEKRGWFYYRHPKGSGRARGRAEALKTQDLTTAVERAVELQSGEAVRRAAVKGTMADVLPVYLAEKSTHSKHTRRQRESILNGFMEIAGNPKLERVTAATIQGWRDHLLRFGNRKRSKRGDHKKARPVTMTTVRSYMIVVRAFFRWAVAEGYLRADPLERFKKDLRVKTVEVKSFLTVEEREAMLEVEAPPAVRAILHFGFFQGLRLEEILAMTPAWLWIADDGSRGTLSVQATRYVTKDGTRGRWIPKGKRKRTMPLHERTLAFLEEYGVPEPWVVAPEREWWPGENSTSYRYDPKKRLAAVAEAAGVKKFTYHMMRRSFGTHLAMQGVELRVIASLLGDRVEVAEDHYVGFIPNRSNPLAGL